MRWMRYSWPREPNSQVAVKEASTGKDEQHFPEERELPEVVIEKKCDEEEADGVGSEEEWILVEKVVQCGPSMNRGVPYLSRPMSFMLP